MKPHPQHPRIRKTIKWGGAVVTVLLVVVWIGSEWGGIGYLSQSGSGFEIAAGSIYFSFRAWLEPYSTGGWQLSAHSGGFDRWPSWRGDSQLWWLRLPLWIPFVAMLLATGAALRLDTLARRRAKLHVCPKCNYDRTGLAAGAVCPECGAGPVGV